MNLMDPMVWLAIGVVALATVGVTARWGLAAGAAACAVLGTLLVPPMLLLRPAVRWEDMLIASGLLALLVGGLARGGFSPRLQLADLFILGLVALPPLSVIHNQQPMKLAGLELLEMTTMWATPYLAGRCLVREANDLRRVAWVVVAALTAYAPLCLWESMTRPALAQRLFGLEGPNVNPTRMLGNFVGPLGYRPYVFTEPFFQLIMLQVAAVVLAMGLCFSRGLSSRRAGAWLAGGGGLIVLATLIGVQRAWVAIILPPAAAALLGLLLLTRWRLWALVAILIVPTYFGLRAFEVIPTAPLPLRNADGSEFLAGRARSINLRISNERAVFDAIADQPYLGTGAAHRKPSGVWAAADHWGVVSGGFTTLLRSGWVGLAFLLVGLTAPAILVLTRVPVEHWRTGGVPLMLAGAVVLIAFAVHLIPNRFDSPIFPLLAGAMVTLSHRAGAQARAGRQPLAPPRDSELQRWAKVCGLADPPSAQASPLEPLPTR